MITAVYHKAEVIIRCAVSEETDRKKELLPFTGKSRGLQKFRQFSFDLELIVEFLLIQLEAGDIIAEAVYPFNVIVDDLLTA